MGFLEAWKESEHRKPLILQGARQVGKTYSILEFGRTHYENVAYFNFETNPKLNETFEENISPDYLIPILSHIAGQTIVLCVVAWIGIIIWTALKLRGSDSYALLGAIGSMLAILFYVVLYNRMMVYVENHAYRATPDKETETKN